MPSPSPEAGSLERNVCAHRLNKFQHELICPAFYQRFLQESESLFREHQLTNEEAAMIERRDWRAPFSSGEAKDGITTIK